MRRFSDIPIRRKLTLVTLLACTSSLVLAGVVLIVWEVFSFRQTMAQDLAILKSQCTYLQWEAAKLGYRLKAPEVAEQVLQLL